MSAWPEIVIAYLLAWMFWTTSKTIVRDPGLSSTWATVGIFIALAFYIGIALVLSAGGFW